MLDAEVLEIPTTGAEKRRVRFSSIEGIGRADLPLACDVWRADVYNSPWAERDSMKLATQLVRYICNPDPNMVLLREVEHQCQLGRDEVKKALNSMRMYGAVDSFTLDRDDVRVYLNLTPLQRLRVLETKRRLLELQG
jgi:hypothetical protein